MMNPDVPECAKSQEAKLGECLTGSCASISEELRESEERFRLIAETIDEIFWLADAPLEKLLYVSPAYERIWKRTCRELYEDPRSFVDAIHPDDRQQILNDLAVVSKGQPFDRKYRIIWPDGSVRWIWDRRYPVCDEAGQLTRYAGAVSDITENRCAEEEAKAQVRETAQMNVRLMEANRQLENTQNQLLQSEKMASIGQLAAGVAHEINNPVGYVYSNLGTLEKYLDDIFAMVDKYQDAEMLLERLGDAIEPVRQFKEKIDLPFLKEDIRSLLSESREGLTRVKKIVLDLKDFSHSGAEEEWKLANLLQGLESTLNIVWNELKYKCEVKKEFGELPQIYCLPSQLNQVFMNLLVNAAQSIEEHGVVTLRTGQEDNRVWVEIADTGKGIPPENLKRIFDPFFTTKPVGKGTGLGLSLSYNIVAKHHGSIEVHSEVGKGTTFRIWLPVEQPEITELA